MRSFLELFFIMIVGLALGGALSWYSIQNNHGFGALKIGVWTAWPQAGSPDSDPYTKAKVAADGEVPLGAAEGIAFFASSDSAGKLLQKQCQYQLIGSTPPARFWTVAAHEKSGDPLRTSFGKFATLVSRSINRKSDNSFSIEVGPNLSSGNWLETKGTGRYDLVLTLYDTPIASTSGIGETQMPELKLLRCGP